MLVKENNSFLEILLKETGSNHKVLFLLGASSK